MAHERKVPVLRSENSLIDQEFDSIRDKFQAEMGKMEEEMAKFRSQLIASEGSRLVGSLNSSVSSSSSRSQDNQRTQLRDTRSAMHRVSERTSSSNSSSSSSKTSSIKVSNQPKTEEDRQQSGGRRVSWLDQLDSPLIKDSGGAKLLKLRFDVSHYEPEEIVVKTVDSRLLVHAKRHESTENRSSYREYNREFLLPAGTSPELIRCSLSADGVLTVEAPLPSTLVCPSSGPANAAADSTGRA